MTDDIFAFEETRLSGDNLEATAHGDAITINVGNPWAGSTETGFGYTCSVNLTADAAEGLAAWLIAKAAALREKTTNPA
jgi:hypothetical protein